MVATESEYVVDEIGVLAPKQVPVDSLSAGEVGYFAASIKTVADARVGDTITLAKDPSSDPLAGYQEAQPMVFCGLFPTENDQYPDLRDALEKLQTNDAALVYEPENSAAMGFGFRCGFLGLLHMEIIQERLEREYDLDLITTAPAVAYRVTTTEGEEMMVDNPSKMPDAATRNEVREPYVRMEIFTPSDYTGALMELAQGRRGELKDVKYLTQTRTAIVYELPLAEVITDFFDEMK